MTPTLTPGQEVTKTLVREAFDVAEERHKLHRAQWERHYRLYRSYRDMADAYGSAETVRGRDVVLGDAQDEWGAELFIPYCFTTIETILPRLLSNRPKILVMPRNKASEDNAPKMRQVIDSQTERIRYELRLQDTAKSGLIYGLGVQKVFWKLEKGQQMQRIRNATGTQGAMQDATFYDDPDVEDVDIFDWFWDPYGSEIENLRYSIHRTWRDGRYCKEQIRSGTWQGIAEEDVDSLGPAAKYDEVHDARMRAAGNASWRTRGSQMHEVWEFHDNVDKRVITMLDREVPVQEGDNPYWHRGLPFSVYRPTRSAIKELPGIGEIDPIEDLQLEMNTLRRQRRDNASLKLQQVFAYAEGFVDINDLGFFPGAAIETKGEPRDLLYPINVGDIPNSGYQEEASLKSDIERTTGIDDSTTGSGDAGQTATGVQLVQAAANVRIQLKTTRLEVDTIAPTGSMIGSMNQQKILNEREIRLPAPPTPGEAERRWTWVGVGPTDLMGEFDFSVAGGSTAPENVPQMRQDAIQFMQTFGGDPQVDQMQVKSHALQLFGVKQPEQWIHPDPVPQSLPQVLVEQLNIDPKKVEQAIQLARDAEAQAAQNPNAGGAAPPGGPSGAG